MTNGWITQSAAQAVAELDFPKNPNFQNCARIRDIKVNIDSRGLIFLTGKQTDLINLLSLAKAAQAIKDGFVSQAGTVGRFSV